MKVAILKGNRLNPWHIRMYEQAARLAQSARSLHFTAFTTPDNLFETSSIQIPVEVVPYEHQAGPLWNKIASRLRYRFQHQKSGYDFAQFGLQERLEPFDIIQSWETFNRHSETAIAAASRFGAKTLITVWDDIAHNMKQYALRNRIKHEVRQKADGFLVYTNAAHYALVEEGVSNDRIHRVWPGIDLAQFLQPAKRPGLLDVDWLGKKPFIVLFAGRLVAQKGILDLLEAADPLCDRVPLRLVFMGSGRDEETLERQILQRGMARQAIIVPRQNYRTMPQWIRFASAVVMPSRPSLGWREQFGMLAIEGMAAEKPVIVSRAPGPEELMGDIPIWVDPGHPEQLREALGILIKDPDLCEEKGHAGRRWAEEHFDQTKSAQTLIDIYSHLLK